MGIHIGFDDIDSPYGGCTTHLVSEIVSRIHGTPWIEFMDYPLLIRLNPGVPWKTRGNGGVVLRLRVPGIDYATRLFEEITSYVEEYVWEYRFPGSHPVVSMVIGSVPDRLKWLGYKAVRDIIPLEVIDRFIEKHRDLSLIHI